MKGAPVNDLIVGVDTAQLRDRKGLSAYGDGTFQFSVN